VGIGRTLVLTGFIIVIIGGIFLLAQRFPWIGRLPGDIYIKRENFSFYFPITTCIIISAVFSITAFFLGRR
jgi:uncharacterized membrane protein